MRHVDSLCGPRAQWPCVRNPRRACGGDGPRALRECVCAFLDRHIVQSAFDIPHNHTQKAFLLCEFAHEDVNQNSLKMSSHIP